MSVVLDASAVIALLLGEQGDARLSEALDGAVIGAVNHAEVVSYYAKLGANREGIEGMLHALPISVVAIDAALAVDAGMLRPATKAAGLSLGDRFCLALAKRLERPALTADRAWADFAQPLGVEVILLR